MHEEGSLSPSGAIIGTPSYMPPEQAAPRRGLPSNGGLTTRADVYSLGAILYELLTGRPPFRAETPLDTLLQVLEKEPARPSSLNPQVDLDLETVCLTCLQKEPGKRYASAEALAEDLDRRLRGEPILARSIGRVERLGRWCRRNAVTATLIGVLVLALLTGTGVSVYFAVQANARATTEAVAREEAVDALARAESNLYLARVALAHREGLARNERRVNQLLDECPAQLRGWEWHFLKRTYRQELSSIPATNEESFWAIAYSPDGAHLALLCSDYSVRIRDAATGRPIHAFPVRRAAAEEDKWQGGGRNDFGITGLLAYSRDGNRLAVACNNRTFYILDVRTGKQLVECRGHERWVTGITFNRDSNWIASSSFDGTVRLWEIDSGKEVRRWNEAEAVAFHPDGRRVATCNTDHTVRLWDAATGREVRTFRAANPADHWDFNRVAFRPDGAQLAAISDPRPSVSFWEVETGKVVQTLSDQEWLGMARALIYSPDGRMLAIGGIDNDVFGGLTVWDLATGEAIHKARRQGGGVLDLTFDPSGRRLAVVHNSREWGMAVRFWAAGAGQEATRYGDPDLPAGHWHTAGVNTSGRVLALATGREKEAAAQTRLWDVEQRQPLLNLPTRLDEATAAALCPRTGRIATHTNDGKVTVWDGHTGKLLVQFPASPPSWFGHSEPPRGICFGADSQLATWCFDHFVEEQNRVKIWDVATGRLLHDLDGKTERVFGVAFDPDGRRLGTVGSNGQLCLWDATTGRMLWSAPVGGFGTSVVFSADGRLVAADAGVNYNAEGATVKIFDAATGEEQQRLSGLVGSVKSIAFSPDNSRIVTADDRLRVWNTLTGQELLALPRPEGMHSLTFTPDGFRLIAVNGKQVQIFDGTPLPLGNGDGEGKD
jgi:WD40 repeat protein